MAKSNDKQLIVKGDFYYSQDAPIEEKLAKEKARHLAIKKAREQQDAKE